MPEGDTIHRTANRLRPVLEGQSDRPFRGAAPDRRPASGPATRSKAVEAVGKNLLVRFPRQPGVAHPHEDDRLVASSIAPTRGWQEPAHLARAVIEVAWLGRRLLRGPDRAHMARHRRPAEPAVSSGPGPVPARRRHRPRRRSGGEHRRSWQRRSRRCCSTSGWLLGSATCTRAKRCGPARCRRSRRSRLVERRNSAASVRYGELASCRPT